jgi:membrane protease YdiL (CAAX protease family)
VPNFDHAVIGSGPEAGALVSAPSPRPPRPFGPLASIGLTVLLVIAMIVVQGAVAIVISIFMAGTAAHAGPSREHALDGLLVSVGSLASVPVVIGVLALFVRARRIPLREYLALRVTGARQSALAVGGMLALMAASDLTSLLLGRPLAPPSMVEIYQSGWHVLVFLAVVLAAPLSEEPIFRGFLYRGMATRIGDRWPPSSPRRYSGRRSICSMIFTAS